VECALQASKEFSDLSTGDHKCRHHAHNFGTRWNQQQFLLESGFDNSSGIEVAIITKNETLQETPSTGLLQHHGKTFDQGIEALAKLLTALSHIAEQMAAFEFLGNGETGSTGKRIAAKGTGVIAGFKEVGFLGDQQCTDGVSTAESLRQRDGIGGNTKVFITPKLSATSHSHLHFIENQQDSLLAAVASDGLKDDRIARDHSPLTLKRFD
jgi:hypothetical protein